MNRCPDLLEEAEVVAVVPDLGDLAVLEAEDVGGGERCLATGRGEFAPVTEMGARSRPSADDEVVTADHEIDAHPEVGKRDTKVVRDPLLTFGPAQRGSWSQIVANVILGENLVREVGVPSIHTSS